MESASFSRDRALTKSRHGNRHTLFIQHDHMSNPKLRMPVLSVLLHCTESFPHARLCVANKHSPSKRACLMPPLWSTISTNATLFYPCRRLPRAVSQVGITLCLSRTPEQLRREPRRGGLCSVYPGTPLPSWPSMRRQQRADSFRKVGWPRP